MKQVMRAGVVLLALGVAACASQPKAPKPGKEASGASTSQLLARSACPLRIVSAEAWRNDMPGPDKVQRGRVSVALRFDDPEAGAVILKSTASTVDTLVLEVRAGESAMQGRADYRDDKPDAAYARVVLRCRGGDIQTITKIETVS